MAAPIGALRVSLSADTVAFEQGLRRAQASMLQFTNMVGARVGALVGGFLSVRGALQAFQSAISDVSALDRLSAATGIGIQQLQSLRAVTEQNGLEWNTLSQTISSFSARLTEGLQSPLSAVSQALRGMGISARDAQGNLQNFDQLLPQISDAFARYADGANKNAIASKLFGEAGGPELARFLNQGSEAIAAQRRAYEATANAIDVGKVREFQAANARLQDAIRQLNIEFTTMAAGPGARVIEALTSMIRWLNESNPATRSLALKMEELNFAVEREALLVDQLANAWSRFTPPAILAARQLSELQPRIAQLRQELQALVTADEDAARRAQERANRPQAPAIDTRGIVEMQAQLQQTLDRLAGTDPTQSIISRMVFGGREPAVWTTAFSDAMAQIDRVGRASGQTATQIANQKVALMQREQQLMQETATLAASTLTAVFSKNKTAAIAAAVINTGVAITRALQLPWPFNWAQAALVAASGAAQIASIKSTSVGGGGTTPSVQGGAGGGDAMASGPGLSGQTLTVEGLSPDSIMSGASVRALAERLIAYQKDGGQVVFAR